MLPKRKNHSWMKDYVPVKQTSDGEDKELMTQTSVKKKVINCIYIVKPALKGTSIEQVTVYKAVFALTHLPQAWDKYNWIRTSENYGRISLNK